MDLKQVLESGPPHNALAVMAGLLAANLSALKTGGRVMGPDVATRIAAHVPGAGPEELMILNRAEVAKKAIAANDQVGALKATTEAAILAEGHELSPHGEAFLDALVSMATKFAEDGDLLEGGKGEDYGDDEGACDYLIGRRR